MNVKEAMQKTFEALMESLAQTKGKYPKTRWSETIDPKIFVGEKDDRGIIGWVPLEKDVIHDFKDIEGQLGIRVHSDIIEYFNSYWFLQLGIPFERKIFNMISVPPGEEFKNVLSIWKENIEYFGKDNLYLFLGNKQNIDLLINNKTGQVVTLNRNTKALNIIFNSLAEFICLPYNELVMIPKNNAEARLFEERALHILKHEKIKNLYESSLVKIFVLKSFDYEYLSCWALYKEFVMRIDWFCRDDLKNFYAKIDKTGCQNEINPTIKYKAQKVDKRFSESIIEELSNISIPLSTKRQSYGHDGTVYELEFGDPWANMKFEWWEDAPKQWEAVEDLTKRLMNEIDCILKNEEYIDSLNYCGKLWLEPNPSVKITDELLSFLKQFSEFKAFNVVNFSNAFNSTELVLMEPNLDYINYKSIKGEFEKYGLKVKLEI